MNAGTTFQIRRHVAVLMIAAVVALSAAYAPALLDGVAGTSLTNVAAACSGNAGGC